VKNLNDLEIYERVATIPYPGDSLGITAIDKIKFLDLMELMQKCTDLPGECIEVGVWRGGFALAMCLFFPDKVNYLCDTFNGIPYSNNKDNYHIPGHFGNTSKAFVQQVLNKSNNYVIIEGIFPHSAKSFGLDNEFCFAHVDVDVYQSYMESLEYLYGRMVEGGIIALDDYRVNDCKGATIAIDEFCKKQKIILHKTKYNYYIRK
jgi:O-methyltransferase